MQEYRVLYNNSSFCYYRFGNGPEPVFCFHGYGENGRSFDFLEASPAGNQFSFFALDLPFHGKTDWKEGVAFTSHDLLRVLEEIRSSNNLAEVRYQVMGFSLGGRMSLCLYQRQPEQVKRLILLAPDGLKLNFWYWLSTQTWLGNRVFQFTMKHPGWFSGFLRMINKLGWVNSSIYKFVNYYIGDPEIRKLLYHRWTGLRKLRPRLPLIKRSIRQFNTSVRLIYGKHDRIILPGRGEKFRKGIEENCSLSVINSGHQVLHEKHTHEILRALLQ